MPELFTQSFFDSVHRMSTHSNYRAANDLVAKRVSWPDLPEELRRDIVTYDSWAVHRVPWPDRIEADRRDTILRQNESVFFSPVPNSNLDLNAINPVKFQGQVLWLEDQQPSKTVVNIHDQDLEIITSGLQLLGENSAVSPHVENPQVTEIIFPLWTLDPKSPDDSPFHSNAAYSIEGNPELAYLHWQTAINTLVDAKYALRTRNNQAITLDVYPKGYDVPFLSIRPLVLPPGKNHSAQSSTQCLYFALKLKPVTPTSKPQLD